ncbi:MAG: cytochrome b/b6 domain-containing protein [Roseovarius sp.]|nr:cytochrome b/b6 domain-containing protein [Roseovarius sp.]
MHVHNSSSRYGSVAKVFHWLTALLILSLIPLGQYTTYLADIIRLADGAPDDGLVLRTIFLFSLHKTLGVAVFFVALLRILWALSQRKPGLLNGGNRPEALAAETVHYLLYGSLVIVPLTGWVHHAATTGFAPIWWPFGQSLPFVAKDDTLAELSTTLHYIFQWVLVGAVALHVAGAFKHHVIDKDATLRRMLPGDTHGQPSEAQPGHFVPLIAALGIWALVLVGASSLGWFSAGAHSHDHDQPHEHSQEVTDTSSSSVPTTETSGQGGWMVDTGTLSLRVIQTGSEVVGSFADWSADITYEEVPDTTGKHGSVTVTVAIASLEMGSVSDQAKGAGYLDAAAFPKAVFDADLIEEDGQMLARGTLTLKGQSMPLGLPFTLDIQDDVAQAKGQIEVNRLDFAIGESGEGTVAFGVSIGFDLTATRAR